jgi:hypothetical protein
VTLEELASLLEANSIPKKYYSLAGGYPCEAYCISQSSNGWRVYYSERGAEGYARAFETEHDACNHFISLLEDELDCKLRPV